ncbi:hypothetical protein AAG570_008498 [Ranatra chinensis]|uniref:Uncharacterized protein n=1 Tax=Ranatra chinensis TaxID=642074 RepID=A0ABD0ZED5_9HEMI
MARTFNDDEIDRRTLSTSQGEGCVNSRNMNYYDPLKTANSRNRFKGRKLHHDLNTLTVHETIHSRFESSNSKLENHPNPIANVKETFAPLLVSASATVGHNKSGSVTNGRTCKLALRMAPDVAEEAAWVLSTLAISRPEVHSIGRYESLKKDNQPHTLVWTAPINGSHERREYRHAIGVNVSTTGTWTGLTGPGVVQVWDRDAAALMHANDGVPITNSSPLEGSHRLLHPRVVWTFSWRETSSVLSAHSDIDRA